VCGNYSRKQRILNLRDVEFTDSGSLILRYNLKSLVEIKLIQSTEAVATELAEILTSYLKTSWSQSPVIQRSISANTDMVADLQLDSFQVMEFMLEVEDHFDVAIDLESLSNTQTIQQLAEVVIAANQAPAETPNQD